MDNKIDLVNTGIYTHWFDVPFLRMVSIRVRYNDGQMSLYMSMFKEPEYKVMTESNNGTEEEARVMMKKYKKTLFEGLDKILGIE